MRYLVVKLDFDAAVKAAAKAEAVVEEAPAAEEAEA